jgi:pimeloyl-ACP methyl ester carboxylesterase
MQPPVENFIPFYFGSPSLFGIYHPSAAPSDHAVVLCASMGQEYIRTHRSFRQLASRLARSGLPTLRFDYYGSGDSAGEDEEANIEQWMSDIDSAVREVKQRSGAGRVSLIGLRLGAALEALVAEQHGGFERLVLWEPVINGADYLAELAERHQDRLSYFLADIKLAQPHEYPSELMGFGISKAFIDALSKINLLTLTQKSTQQALIIESQPQPGSQTLQEHLNKLGIPTQYLQVEGPRVWTEDPDKALVPHQVLQTMVNWMEEK